MSATIRYITNGKSTLRLTGEKQLRRKARRAGVITARQQRKAVKALRRHG